MTPTPSRNTAAPYGCKIFGSRSVPIGDEDRYTLERLVLKVWPSSAGFKPQVCVEKYPKECDLVGYHARVIDRGDGERCLWRFFPMRPPCRSSTGAVYVLIDQLEREEASGFVANQNDREINCADTHNKEVEDLMDVIKADAKERYRASKRGIFRLKISRTGTGSSTVYEAALIDEVTQKTLCKGDCDSTVYRAVYELYEQVRRTENCRVKGRTR